ncbi:MAG: phytanoyl-CoA dioxygenase family protein [Gammaproteobacteria bacterium]
MRDPVKGGDSGIDQDDDKNQSTQRPEADEMIQRFHATDDLADMQSSLMRNGAVIIEKVVDSELITTITTDLRPAFDAEGDQFANDFNGYRTRRLGGVLRYSAATAQLLEHPLVMALADAALGPHCTHYQVGSTTAIEILPGEAAQVLHRDDECYPILMDPIEFQISALWSLDAFTDLNGATEVIPRSSQSEGAAPEKAIMPAGSVLVYLGSTRHGGGANHSDAPRAAIVNTYALGWLRQEENQYLTLPRAVVEAQTDSIKRLLGFQAYSRSLGVWPEDPDGFWFES